MHSETLSNCRDFQKRFDLFLDGELDGRTMRSLAMHVTRCEACEADVRRSERLQETLGEAVESVVDEIDVESLWRDVAGRLERPSPTWRERIRERWRRDDASATAVAVRLTAVAAGFALLVVAADSLFPAPGSPPEHLVSNKAHIDRLASSSPAVAVWTEPHQQTTAIWVASVEP